eukprot:10399334-Lingulodinium_polyedra.AAC.1
MCTRCSILSLQLWLGSGCLNLLEGGGEKKTGARRTISRRCPQESASRRCSVSSEVTRRTMGPKRRMTRRPGLGHE